MMMTTNDGGGEANKKGANERTALTFLIFFLFCRRCFSAGGFASLVSSLPHNCLLSRLSFLLSSLLLHKPISLY